MKNFRFLSLLVMTVAILPLAFFIWTASSTLKNHIRPIVANDPQTNLAQSLSGLHGAYNQWTSKIYLNALHFSQKENFKKFMGTLKPSLDAFKVFGSELGDSTKCPLVILTDKKGGVLYSSLPIAKTTLPTATPVKKDKHLKSIVSSLPSLKDFPGIEKALAGNTLSGFFTYQDVLYEGSLVPVSNHEKTLGAVILAVRIDSDYIKFLKYDVMNDLAIYSQAQTWCSRPVLPPKIDYVEAMEAMASSGHQGDPIQVDWNHGVYLSGGFPLYGLDMKPLAFIATFQPVKQILTVEGNPQKTIVRWGWWFLLGAVLLALAALWQYSLPFNRLVEAIDQIKAGNFNLSLPVGRLDELGRMARSLQEMVEGFKEKNRVSLILGKVVSPQIAKNVLEANDLFALKGERRECTVFYADLRGFNTLSENMTPQALVEALNQYFGLINDIVFKHEGMLDKFIGDTAIAVWGAPFSHEDKELRAVKAALEIQEALKDFNISRIKKGHPPFTIGIGIHTGMVVAGNLGSDKRYDYTIIGDPLHVVARLCAMASPGQTVVSEETYQKIKPLVKAHPLNPIAVKGSMESLKTYEITQLL